MDSIGSTLKENREKKGLSFQEVYENTRITIPNLEALEQDRFDFFPNKVYTRAFLRDYANFLGLDSSVLLDKYEKEWFPSVVEEKPEVKPVVKSKLPLAIAAIILVIALFAGGYYIYYKYYSVSGSSHESQQVSTEKKNIPSSEADKNAGVPAPLPPVTDNNKLPDLSAGKSGSSTQQSTSADKNAPTDLTLSVNVIKQVWARITVDGETAYEGILNAGTVKTWVAKKKIKVRSGKINALQIKLNGEPKKLVPTSKSRVPIGEAEFAITSIKTNPPTTP